MTVITEIKLIMWTSIVDEQIESRTQTRNMNSTTISNRKKKHIRCNGSSTVGVEVVAHVVEEEVAEVGEEVIVDEVVVASSRESALPKFP